MLLCPLRKEMCLLCRIAKKVCIVVSNPPYVTESEKRAMESNVLDWEPGLALFVPDNDPLCFIAGLQLWGENF